MKTMPNWLKQRAFLTPDRIALETEREQLTFWELHQRVASLAGKMHSAGAVKGSQVAVLMRNSIQMVVTIHALAYIGATAVLLNTRLSEEELAWQINDAEVSILLTDDALRDYGRSITTYTIEELSSLQEQPYLIQEEFCSDTIMTIIYTSGTTGNPKGVLLTYGNHWSSAVGSALNIGFRENDCWLACLPFFHVGGLSILLKSVIYGMRIVLVEKVDAAALNQAIQERGVTIVSVVTKVLTDMVRCLGEGAYPTALRCVLLGGGPAPKPLLEECMKRGIPVYQTYGMTETASQICTLSSDYMLTKVGSAGKPLFFCQLRIEANGEAAPVNIPGEIVVKGPNVAKGYFKREAHLDNGWLRTGDIGYLDQEGFLYVLDRRSDLIISGGENIYPAQIEEVLLAHPDVEEAGVVGRKDETWGQVPVAFVRKAETSLVTEEELLMFCSKRLARYKIPQEIQFVDALPRNASNKLLRRELKQRLGENAYEN